MKLLPNESTLVTSNQDKVILTDHRIHMNDKEWGRSYSISIFLENISSIETKYNSLVIFLILGVLAALAGIFLTIEGLNENGMFLSFIVSIALFIFWWLSRRHVISVSSNGGSKLNFEVTKMSDEKIMAFVHNISEAQQKRIQLLQKDLM